MHPIFGEAKYTKRNRNFQINRQKRINGTKYTALRANKSRPDLFLIGFCLISHTRGSFLCDNMEADKGRTKKNRPQLCDLTYQEALKYLRGEALVLPEGTPKGIVTVGYKGFALGEVKNIGTRANNLYPKSWRIKTTHLPTEPPEIISFEF